MKLAEFYALCDREWAKPKRGDVVSLLLTGPSAAELALDSLMNSTRDGFELNIQESELPAIRSGAGINRVVNPITRTVVEIRVKKDGVRETARVRVMGGTYRQTWWPANAEAA
jgi:hypothetical protein